MVPHMLKKRYRDPLLRGGEILEDLHSCKQKGEREGGGACPWVRSSGGP